MKITIERETLERAISDYDAAAGNDGALLTLVRTRTALFDLLRKALAQPADNEWRTAIEEELICAHIGTADSFPDAKSALKSLLDWHVAVSLDPQVSSAAQALIDRGQALAQPAEPVAIKDRAAAYETIDRYLRNNLDDSDYAGYSAALEEVWNGSQAAQPAPAAVPVDAHKCDSNGVVDQKSANVAHKPLAAVPQWLPIESAPRDGTAVLVMRDIWPGTDSGRAEECNSHNTYVAAWWHGERDGRGAWICYMDAVQDPECPIDPTHWMPLPLPPSAGGAA